MKKICKWVRSFHAQNNYPLDRDLGLERIGFFLGPTDVDKTLNELAKFALVLSKKMESLASSAQEEGDGRLYRVNLILEELGELAGALADRDEVAAADALGDLEYVVVGTAETYGIPLETVVHAIHVSNMNKATRTLDDPRMRNKGSRWKKPDIEEAIKQGRLARTNFAEGSAEHVALSCWTDPRTSDRQMDVTMVDVIAEKIEEARESRKD